MIDKINIKGVEHHNVVVEVSLEEMVKHMVNVIQEIFDIPKDFYYISGGETETTDRGSYSKRLVPKGNMVLKGRFIGDTDNLDGGTPTDSQLDAINAIEVLASLCAYQTIKQLKS